MLTPPNSRTLKQKEQPAVPLQTLIDRYFQSDIVNLKCDKKANCQGKRAQKQYRMVAPVNALAVHLERNRKDRGDLSKSRQRVSFDADHDFVVWDSDFRASKIFRKPLVAIVSHWGESVTQGHYKAYVRDPRSGIWYEYDDDRVRSVTWSTVKSLTKEVKMLFFGPGREIRKVCLSNNQLTKIGNEKEES